jgi:pyruvate/2-oxoglutarate dehydrogenase complex dihydrolipoamide acyltransferase (E2) component
MFATGLGNLVNITPHAVSLSVGGIDWVPFNVEGKVVNREMAGLCLAVDNDVVNGGSATRFLHDFRQYLMNFCLDADWCFKSLVYP